jgi:hypothetical protein
MKLSPGGKGSGLYGKIWPSTAINETNLNI